MAHGVVLPCICCLKVSIIEKFTATRGHFDSIKKTQATHKPSSNPVLAVISHVSHVSCGIITETLNGLQTNRGCSLLTY